MLKQKLQQKLLQKLSPQQIQMIKLLEVPTIQIEQRIKKELEENPALEEGPEDEGDLPEENEEDLEPDENG
ncbi:MAG: RNA polymerase sigma-54 factor, partial [Bacteroidales bacterium]|nr:RNA polymerase sigma-54 factor [Bacteroidales bacterium]